MYSDAVINAIRGGFTTRCVGGDDERFVTGPTQMLEDPDHRITDTIDLREERFGDDGNAHTTTVSALAVPKVAYGHTSCEICSSHSAGSG